MVVELKNEGNSHFVEPINRLRVGNTQPHNQEEEESHFGVGLVSILNQLLDGTQVDFPCFCVPVRQFGTEERDTSSVLRGVWVFSPCF